MVLFHLYTGLHYLLCFLVCIDYTLMFQIIAFCIKFSQTYELHHFQFASYCFIYISFLLSECLSRVGEVGVHEEAAHQEGHPQALEGHYERWDLVNLC